MQIHIFFYIPVLGTWNGIHLLSDCFVYLATKQLADFHMLLISLKNGIIYSCIGITALNKKYFVYAFFSILPLTKKNFHLKTKLGYH